MNIQVSPQMLEGIISVALEEVAFLFVQPSEGEAKWNGRIIQADIMFSGPCNGKLVFALDPQLGVEIASNMIGSDIDETETEAKSLSACSELLNIMGGMVLEKLFGNNPDYRLGLPSVKFESPEIYESDFSQAESSIVLNTDDGRRVDLSIIFTDSP